MRLEPIQHIPNGLELSAWSQTEFDRTTPEGRAALEQQSRSMWLSHAQGGETIAVIGAHVPHSGPVELWCLICREFRKHLRRNLPVLRDHIRFVINLYPRCIVRVDAEAPAGRRFTEYLGFRLAGSSEVAGRDYMVFEVSKWLS